MSKYKDFLVVESDLDIGEIPEVIQILDFIKAPDIKNAAKIAKNRGYNIHREYIAEYRHAETFCDCRNNPQND